MHSDRWALGPGGLGENRSSSAEVAVSRDQCVTARQEWGMTGHPFTDADGRQRLVIDYQSFANPVDPL
jgi:hypothetical protein